MNPVQALARLTGCIIVLEAAWGLISMWGLVKLYKARRK